MLRQNYSLTIAASLLLLVLACGGGGGGGSTPSPQAPLIRSFAPSARVVPMGTTITLSWDLDGSVTILTLDGATRSAISGSVQTTPLHRQTFTLVASDGRGRRTTSNRRFGASFKR